MLVSRRGRWRSVRLVGVLRASLVGAEGYLMVWAGPHQKLGAELVATAALVVMSAERPLAVLGGIRQKSRRGAGGRLRWWWRWPGKYIQTKRELVGGGDTGLRWLGRDQAKKFRRRTAGSVPLSWPAVSALPLTGMDAWPAAAEVASMLAAISPTAAFIWRYGRIEAPLGLGAAVLDGVEILVVAAGGELEGVKVVGAGIGLASRLTLTTYFPPLRSSPSAWRLR